MIKTPIWKDLLSDAWKYYNKDPNAFGSNFEFGNGAGGSLHIVLDDGNISDEDVEYCIKFAQKYKDAAGKVLAEQILQLHWRQRARLYLNYHLYCYGAEEPKLKL